VTGNPEVSHLGWSASPTCEARTRALIYISGIRERTNTVFAGYAPNAFQTLARFGQTLGIVDSPPLSKRNAARNQPVFVRLSVQILTEIGMRE